MGEKTSRSEGERAKMEHPAEKRLKTTSSRSREARELPPCKNLSDDVIEHIFSFLSIREATEKSVLAKRFERSWQLSQHLCFDQGFSKDRSSFQTAQIIQHILTHHSAKKILTFELCVNPLAIENLITCLIKLAVSKEPNVVHLDFVTTGFIVAPYEIPFEVIDSQSIQVLRLSYCWIDFPPKFKALHFLQTLVLRHVRIKSTFFNTIVENCLLLESVDIVRCFEARRLKIVAKTLKFFKELKIGDCCQLEYVYVDAPTLEIFHFVGKPYTIGFEGRMNKLKDVMINFRVASYIFPRFQMENLMWQISHVRVLTVSSTLLEDLCSTFIHGRNLRGPKQYLWHIKELQLLMDTTSFCNPYDLICFVDNCPHLERLFIDLQKFSFDEKSLYWELHDRHKFEHSDKQFPFLKLVKFSSFKFKLMEVKLVKFFLEKSPNLENLAIFTMRNFHLVKFSNVALGFLKHLISWRSSPRAKVGVYEYGDKEDDVLAPQHQDLWYGPV